MIKATHFVAKADHSHGEETKISDEKLRTLYKGKLQVNKRRTMLGTFALCVSLMPAIVHAQKSGEMKPVFLKQGKELLNLDFAKGTFDPKVVLAKQESLWTVIDGVLIGKPSSADQRASKKGHDGSNPIVAVNLIDQQTIIRMDFMFQADTWDGKPSIQFGHHVSQITLSDSDTMLESGTSADREQTALKSGKWYALVAEVMNDELLVTISGVRSFYISNEQLTAEKKAFKIRGPESSKVFIKKITMHKADGIQDDWKDRKSTILTSTKPETLLAKKPRVSKAVELASVTAEEVESNRGLRIVFFTPSDIEPPAEGVRERLKEYVDYSQMFYGKWMKHWGYPSKNPLPVERDGDGFPKILYVKGRHTKASGRYEQLSFMPEIQEEACRQHDLDPHGLVLWSFIYGGPDSRGFRGGGNSRKGGMSTSLYDPTTEGHLNLTDDLGSDVQMSLKSKASIHELGHALGLPHIGPRINDKLGCSLMGPVIKAYRKRNPTDERIYLSEASAAMVWKHPIFSGVDTDREIQPKLEFANVKVKHDPDGKRLLVSGEVVSDYAAHSVVIADEHGPTGGYWTKCYVGRVNEAGEFEVSVDELESESGNLRIVCCFNNGAIVGRDEGLGLNSGFLKRYTFANGSYETEGGWATNEPNKPRRRKGRGTNKGAPQ